MRVCFNELSTSARNINKIVIETIKKQTDKGKILVDRTEMEPK